MVATGTVGQRFTQLIAHLGISKNAFASSLEKTATVIQHIVDERNKPGFDLLCKVFEVYPNVSKDWLLQGKGSMLASGSSLPNELTSAVARRPVAEPRPETSQPVQEPVAVSPSVPVAPALATAPVAAPSVAVAAPSVANPVETEVPVVAPVIAAPLTAPVAPAPAPAPADTSWQTALYTQQMAHQLAMAELRNQHLQEQQRMMQQMLDLMKLQMGK